MLFTTSDSNSSYNSLQTKITKRFSSGFSVLAAWTFAKSITDNEEAWNGKADVISADFFDSPNRFFEQDAGLDAARLQLARSNRLAID